MRESPILLLNLLQKDYQIKDSGRNQHKWKGIHGKDKILTFTDGLIDELLFSIKSCDLYTVTMITKINSPGRNCSVKLEVTELNLQ